MMFPHGRIIQVRVKVIANILDFSYHFYYMFYQEVQ